MLFFFNYYFNFTGSHPSAHCFMCSCCREITCALLQVGLRDALEAWQCITYLHRSLSLQEQSWTDRRQRRRARKQNDSQPPRRSPTTQHKHPFKVLCIFSIYPSLQSYELNLQTFVPMSLMCQTRCPHFANNCTFGSEMLYPLCTFDLQRSV